MPINAGTLTAPERSSYAWLAGIVAAGFLARLWLLFAMPEGWVDPDHYMRNGWQLATGTGPLLDRVVAAAAYPFAGLTFYLPPLYPVFLAVSALLPGYPWPAAIAQCAINAAMPAVLFFVGNRIGSTRTGMVAAVVFAVWPPGLNSGRVFMQEQLYIPLLVVAFALFVRYYGDARATRHVATGVVFGLAALTRAMILYYVAALPVMVLLVERSWRPLRVQLLPLLAGAALVVVPYSLFVSAKTGHAMLIENHAGFDMMRYSDGDLTDKPTVNTGMSVVIDAIVRRPAAFLRDWWTYVRTLYKPFGTRWLEGFGAFQSRGTALAGSAARLLVDALYLAVLGLAPVGLVLLAPRRLPLLLAAWVALVTAATAFSGVGGARYRAPVDPVLIVLAAAAIGRPWRPRRAALGATAVGIAIVLIVTAGVPSANWTPMYGFASWSAEHAAGRSTADADAALTLPPTAFGLTLSFPGRRAADGPVRVQISLDRTLVVDRPVVPSPVPARFTWSRSGYVRIRARDETHGRPVAFEIAVLK